MKLLVENKRVRFMVICNLRVIAMYETREEASECAKREAKSQKFSVFVTEILVSYYQTLNEVLRSDPELTPGPVNNS